MLLVTGSKIIIGLKCFMLVLPQQKVYALYYYRPLNGLMAMVQQIHSFHSLLRSFMIQQAMVVQKIKILYERQSTFASGKVTGSYAIRFNKRRLQFLCKNTVCNIWYNCNLQATDPRKWQYNKIMQMQHITCITDNEADRPGLSHGR